MLCLGTAGTMRMAVMTAIEVHLRLPSLHLQLEEEAKAGLYRMDYNSEWKPKSKGFWTCMHDWEHSTRNYPMDRD
jgi:hypothetical protein